MTAVDGYLEIMDRGFGFLRDIRGNFEPQTGDVFVPAGLIRNHQLREGSHIAGKGARGEGNLKLSAVHTVDGLAPEERSAIPQIWDRTSIDPSDKFTLTTGPGDLTGMALDLMVPMGKGQRGLVIAPPKSGKTTILRHLANAMIKNHPDVQVFVLLVDERPEEVTDFRRGLGEAAHVLYSCADQSISRHMRMTRMAVHAAIRSVELGKDAVVLIDSLTRMARAFNVKTDSHGRTLSGGLGANALAMPRKIFGAARNLEKGGSLTIVASILVDTGSRMDEVIYQEFKGTGNMDLVLSRECAEARVFPSIDIHQSGTRKEELLLAPADLKRAVDIRRSLTRRDPVAAMSDLLEYLDRQDRR